MYDVDMSGKEKAERNKQVFDKIREGKSYNEIARELGTTPQNIGRIVKQHKSKYQK